MKRSCESWVSGGAPCLAREVIFNAALPRGDGDVKTLMDAGRWLWRGNRARYFGGRVVQDEAPSVIG